MANGHVYARHYPLAMVEVEARIVANRVNMRMVTESLLMQGCIGTVMNGRKGGRHYADMIEKLKNGR